MVKGHHNHNDVYELVVVGTIESYPRTSAMGPYVVCSVVKGRRSKNSFVFNSMMICII